MTLWKLIPEKAWMAKIDLHSAYLHVPIHPRFQKFLAFSFQGKLFFYKALPFGLSPAPYIFSRIMTYPVQILRKKEVNVLAYLDDLIFWGRTKWEVRRAVTLAKQTFSKLGFLLNYEKSVTRPTQRLIWLGLSWRTLTFSVSLPKDFQKRMREKAIRTLASQKISRRELESLQGLMAFAGQVLPRARFQSHKLPRFMKSFTQQRDNLLPLVPQLRQALRWWSIPANLASSAPIRDAPPAVHLWTDASTSGFGAHNDSGRYIQGHWSEAHIGLHINAKELLAIALALESELVPERSSAVIFTDSKVAFFTIKNKGSNRFTVLQSIEDRVLKATELKNLSILPIHLKGESNVTADALSRDKPIP